LLFLTFVFAVFIPVRELTGDVDDTGKGGFLLLTYDCEPWLPNVIVEESFTALRFVLNSKDGVPKMSLYRCSSSRRSRSV